MTFLEAKKKMDEYRDEYQMSFHFQKFDTGKTDSLCVIKAYGHTFESWKWEGVIDQVKDHIGDYRDNLTELTEGI